MKVILHVPRVTRRSLGSGIVLLGLVGCATMPDPRLEEAKVAVRQLSSEGDVVRAAPVAVAEAEEELGKAQQTEDPEEAGHRAQLALLKVQTARAMLREKQAQARTEAAERKADQLQLDARARQAEEALRQASAAQRRAEELRREATAERVLAANERARAEAERSRTRVERSRVQGASQRLNEVRQSLGELSPKLTNRGLVLTFGEVLFDFDTANLKPYTQRIVDQLANFLQRHADYMLQIEGHTDSEGTATYNLELSRARAKSVADALIARGISFQRMSVSGYGESRPLASNETAAGRRENRRVEVIVGPG